MKGYTWKEASLQQLYQVAFGEEPCSDVERNQAVQEINRRKRERHGRKSFREKKHYPR